MFFLDFWKSEKSALLRISRLLEIWKKCSFENFLTFGNMQKVLLHSKKRNFLRIFPVFERKIKGKPRKHVLKTPKFSACGGLMEKDIIPWHS